MPTEWQYTGQELDGGTGLVYLHARYYDPATGQFLSPDTLVPEPGNVLAYNRYMYSYGNPLRYSDPSGHDPYPLFVRAFAPYPTFGLGFSGDDRNYSLDADATARVSQQIAFDTDLPEVQQRVWSDPSHYRLLSLTDTATPSGGVFQFAASLGEEKRNWAFASEFAGSNPIIPFAPNIDVMAAFSIIEDRTNSTLRIVGLVKGDHFPATEVFVQDPYGQSLFLGVGPAQGNPFASLAGKNERPITSFDVTIQLTLDGLFAGVWMQGKYYFLEEWNRFFTSQDARGEEP